MKGIVPFLTPKFSVYISIVTRLTAADIIIAIVPNMIEADGLYKPMKAMIINNINVMKIPASPKGDFCKNWKVPVSRTTCVVENCAVKVYENVLFAVVPKEHVNVVELFGDVVSQTVTES